MHMPTLTYSLVCLLLVSAVATVSSLSPAAPGFASLPYNYEVSAQPLATKGQPPQWLSGTLYRNGPGYYANAPTNPHWFDGLAFLHGYSFNDGSVAWNAAFVGSTPYNQSAPSHTNKHKHKLHQQQQPYSPNTAVTIQLLSGELFSSTATTISNQFTRECTNAATPFIFNDTFPSELLPSPEHRKADLQGNLYHFAYLPESGNPQYLFYLIPANTLTRQVLLSLPVPTINYQHSFSLTQRFIVLSDIPVPLPLSFDWQQFQLNSSQPTVWRVIDIEQQVQAFTFTSPPIFTFHHINAYEDTATNSIIVDLIAYPNCSIIQTLYLNTLMNNPSVFLSAASLGQPVRYVLPLNQHNAETLIQPTIIAHVPVELPTVNPLYDTQAYTYFYAVSVHGPASVFFDSLVKVNVKSGLVQSWFADINTFPGEPIFVPSPQASVEDAGVVLSVVLDAMSLNSYVLVLDGSTFTELARATTTRVMPLGFHGKFVHDYQFNNQTVDKQ